MSNEILIFLSAMVPIGEIRVALPIALVAYKMNIASAYLLAVAGNMVPVFLLLLFWRYLAEWLIAKSKVGRNFFEWLFERTRNRFADKYARWGKLALVIFVAIPLPITGAWTGTLAASLFGFKYWESIGLIFLGVLISGVIVGLLTLGGIGIVK